MLGDITNQRTVNEANQGKIEDLCQPSCLSNELG